MTRSVAEVTTAKDAHLGLARGAATGRGAAFALQGIRQRGPVRAQESDETSRVADVRVG